jgi:hypothetical protein
MKHEQRLNRDTIFWFFEDKDGREWIVNLSHIVAIRKQKNGTYLYLDNSLAGDSPIVLDDSQFGLLVDLLTDDSETEAES